MAETGRLILSGANPPAFNMAADEALGLHAETPVLRFYQWEPPAISLGYFQKEEEVCDILPELGNPPVVRRITGGGAIYHFEELTYSLIGPPQAFHLPGSTAESYRFLHAPFVKVFRDLGIEARDNAPHEAVRKAVCFDSITHYDVSVGERKLLGSAQRRHKRFFLQHGSIPLKANPFSAKATSIEEELGREVTPDELADLLYSAISIHLDIDFRLSEMTAEELETAEKLLEKYGYSE
jgi:lipoate-protein ligase A